MSPRGAALVVVLVVIALGAYAGWLVGVPTPVVALAAGLVFGIALRRFRKRGTARPGPDPSGPASATPPRDRPGVGGD